LTFDESLAALHFGTEGVFHKVTSFIIWNYFLWMNKLVDLSQKNQPNMKPLLSEIKTEIQTRIKIGRFVLKKQIKIENQIYWCSPAQVYRPIYPTPDSPVEGGSYTPPVSGAGARGRVPRPRRRSSWAAAHKIHCVCFSFL
jgi:hypothetical protein